MAELEQKLSPMTESHLSTGAELDQKEPPLTESHPPAVAELEQKEPPMTELEGEHPMTEVSLIASLSLRIGYKGGL